MGSPIDGLRDFHPHAAGLAAQLDLLHVSGGPGQEALMDDELRAQITEREAKGFRLRAQARLRAFWHGS
jgi:hypothetical protein